MPSARPGLILPPPALWLAPFRNDYALAAVPRMLASRREEGPPMSADPTPGLQLHQPTVTTPAPVSADRACNPVTAGSAPQLCDKLLVTRAELSQLTGLDVRTLARLDAASEIPGRIKIGRSVRYDLTAIKEWIASGC